MYSSVQEDYFIENEDLQKIHLIEHEKWRVRKADEGKKIGDGGWQDTFLSNKCLQQVGERSLSL